MIRKDTRDLEDDIDDDDDVDEEPTRKTSIASATKHQSKITVETNFSDVNDPVVNNIKNELNRISKLENIDSNKDNEKTSDVTLSTRDNIKHGQNEVLPTIGDSKLSLMPLKANEVNEQGIEKWRNIRTSQLTSHFYIAAMIVLICM